jgi:hypothetical protein
MRHGRRGIGFVHVDDVEPLVGVEQHVGVVRRLEIVSEDGLVNRGLQGVDVLSTPSVTDSSIACSRNASARSSPSTRRSLMLVVSASKSLNRAILCLKMKLVIAVPPP